MREQIIKVIADYLDIPDYAIEDNDDLYNDLGLDSLDFVELMLLLQEDLLIEFPDDKSEKFKKVKDIINFVENSKNV